jgi:hypothetical protein
MGIFDHTRFKVMSQSQHPYRHDVSEFAYANTAVPGANNLEDILDYIVSALYPNHVGSYDTLVAAQAAHPTPSANDYVVVRDDGDGRAAGYVYRVVDGASGWHKFYDVDWTTESLLGETINRTQYMYVHKYGMTDKDAAGSAIVGTYAGQRIYGGDLTGQNLTLNANSADTTGFVQSDNTLRPTADGTLDLGTAALKWGTLHSSQANAGTLSITSGSITDSSGAISFSNENLSTTGTLASGALTVTGAASTTGSLTVAQGATGAITISESSIVSGDGSIDFVGTQLVTSAEIYGHSITVGPGATTVLSDGSLTNSDGTISFGGNSLEQIDVLDASTLNAVTAANIGNLTLSGNTILANNVNGNLALTANGTGVVNVTSAMTTVGQTVTGTVTISGQLNADNLRLDGNRLSSENANGNINITPNGTGVIRSEKTHVPGTDASFDLGSTSLRWTNIYLSGAIGDGTTTIASSVLQSLRDINVGVGSGFSLFWNGSKWVSSLPDTEVDHGTITGLGDDDHAQYALLAGRAGGQTLVGGTLTTQNLTLRPNAANTTTGAVIITGTLRPEADLTRDLGNSSVAWKDVYAEGQFYGLRLENVASIGAATASASNTGRLVYALDEDKTYVDDGGAWRVLGVSKFLSDTSWNGSDTTKTVTVSASVSDARRCIWQLSDNANDFERIEASIKAISATQVTITVNVPLALGSYRLIGIE